MIILTKVGQEITKLDHDVDSRLWLVISGHFLSSPVVTFPRAFNSLGKFLLVPASLSLFSLGLYYNPHF